MSSNGDEPHDLRLSWSILAGALPLLVIGFTASALANRLVFVAWGAAFAAVHAGLVRYGRDAGWRRPALAIGALAALGSFAVLAAWHREVLTLGLSALLP
jgi:hypothetical protein